MLIVLVVMALGAPVAGGEPLAGTQPLLYDGDPAAGMVAGIDAFLDRQTVEAVKGRDTFWAKGAGSAQAVEQNRERLRSIVGAVDSRVAPRMELCATTDAPGPVGSAPGYDIYEVRWRVLEGVTGEGLLLEPKERPVASVVAIPDCDWTPEAIAGLDPARPDIVPFAKRLAEAGCRVVVPVLIDRRDTYSGHAEVRSTDQPHREFLYRPAYQMGRHPIGYEVQKVLAAVDWFQTKGNEPIGVFGYGEGGLVAFYAAALDTRIGAAAVSGYFGPREHLWSEPIYRNVWGLLERFGDAEVAALIHPRTLVIETCDAPTVEERSVEGRREAAPGRIPTPSLEAVRSELARVEARIGAQTDRCRLIEASGQRPGQEATIAALLEGLGVPKRAAVTGAISVIRGSCDPKARMKRQFDELLEHTQRLVRESPKRREEYWAAYDDAPPESHEQAIQPYRERFLQEIIGRFPEATLPANARTRLVYDEPAYRGYEVMLDVFPEVFAYGILLVPKDLVEGERRPVVVCQHGLEGRPQELCDAAVDSHYYHRFGCRLAEEGFVVFAPQNPYIGGDRFRVLQRKANPLGKSLFGVITRQHEAILGWLGELPFVERERIAFYGLSYGGKTAMRVPALLPGYCLSICSGDFNEWIWKTTSNREPFSYLYTGEYEMFEFNLGNTFNYAEMARLIFPRPFMVERGHRDGVAPDEWVAYEFAQVRRFYDERGLGDRAELEFFNGPHEIHGVGTFAFLRHHLLRKSPLDGR